MTREWITGEELSEGERHAAREGVTEDGRSVADMVGLEIAETLAKYERDLSAAEDRVRVAHASLQAIADVVRGDGPYAATRWGSMRGQIERAVARATLPTEGATPDREEER